MKRAGRLMERVWDRDNLREAFARAARGKRARRDAAAFAARLDENLADLARDLADGTYSVGPYHQFTIFDPKERVITAPCFRDRVLHHAVTLVCEPVFERFLIGDTFACRKGKGRLAAVERAQRFARRAPWFLKLDIRKYFNSIRHDILLAMLGRTFKDRRLLDLFGRIIASHEVAPGLGLPIGSLTSQHFANFYLGRLDRFVKEGLRAGGYVRYMDDFVVWGEDRSGLAIVRDRIGEYLTGELSLDLKPEPYINRTACGMDFLGCRIYPTHVLLNRRSRVRFARKVRWLEREHAAGRLDEAALQHRAAALVAFARAGPTTSWRWRHRVLQSLAADGHGPEPGDPGR
ncbi:Group II intron-encoded protein LtrA [Aquisphaera giovannonii]|uniref:Group II intron-encoded protein LtrA n=1 Tax=Aquisphaera giovannonii TaxID=406548 RepID=A0A5B9WDW6_9BACT|nr:reverse transcriptase/maturase family protein [Aquisphaera giovannonii]QEH38394.1 Group II intron-encoded protein LtrA [Aquisphaera giovannonii]